MSSLEFERRVGQGVDRRESIGPMDPDANIRDSHVRAQEQFNRAVGFLKAPGAVRVILEVDGNNTRYTLVQKEPQNGSRVDPLSRADEGGTFHTPFRLEGRPITQLIRKTAKKDAVPKKGKAHDLRGFTGRYGGVYYENGAPRPRVPNKTKRKARSPRNGSR